MATEQHEEAARAALVEASGEDEARVEALYLPVYRWARAQRTAWQAQQRRGRAFVLGVSGPQGCGKSTLCAALVRALAATGLRAAALSVDDAYLTHAQQRALAAAHPGNPYLEHRGYPGTHDVALGAYALDALAHLAPGARYAPPRYDKSAHGGRGDRAPEARWPRCEGPLDVLLFEGWMLGFAPVPEGALPDERLRPANAALRDYATWHARLDALVHLDAAQADYVVRWRVDAERARRAAGQSTLSDEAASDYVRRFLVAYETYVPGLRARPPVAGPALRVVLGPAREVVSR